MTQIEQIFRTHFENNRTDDRDLDLLHATDAVREYIKVQTDRQRISLPHWCNLAKLDQVFGNKGVFGRFCQELQDDLDAARAKIAAEKENPALKVINDLKDELEGANRLIEGLRQTIDQERGRVQLARESRDELQEENDRLKEEMSELEEENAELKEENRSYHFETLDLKKRLIEIEIKLSRLQDSLGAERSHELAEDDRDILAEAFAEIKAR